MSRKKKRQQIPQSDPALPRAPLPSSEAFTRQITFDSLEDKIRGEEMMQEQEQKRIKEEQAIKKELDSVEIDRRMEELRRQVGLKNSKKKSR